MSAQDTTPGQTFSNAALISAITSNPPRVRFGTASFSAVLFAVESISIEASQPQHIIQRIYILQKHRRHKCDMKDIASHFEFQRSNTFMSEDP